MKENNDTGNKKITNEQVRASVKDEVNLNSGLKEIEESYYPLFKVDKRKIKPYELHPITPKELENREKQSLLINLKIRPNRLQSTSGMKVFWSYFGAFAATLAEYFVFQAIAMNVLGIEVIQSYFVALFSVVFTKFLQVIMLPQIKKWINENNPRLRSWFKTLLFLFAILILINSVIIGINNILNIDRIERLENISFLQEQDPDSPELREALEETQENNILYSIVRFFAIAFLGFLAIPCGAILWALGDFYSEALKLRKRIDLLKKEVSRLRSNFQYSFSTYTDLLLLQKEIVSLFGHKFYCERLMSIERANANHSNTE